MTSYEISSEEMKIIVESLNQYRDSINELVIDLVKKHNLEVDLKETKKNNVSNDN